MQVGGHIVQDWIHHDPLLNVTSSDIIDCHRHPEVKRKLYSAYAECDEGELAIPIPRQVPVKSQGHASSSGLAFRAGEFAAVW